MQVTLAGLHETFSDAKDIMKWLGTCAKLIASHNEAVQWSTPLGLPVVQPYRQVVSKGGDAGPWVLKVHGSRGWLLWGQGQLADVGPGSLMQRCVSGGLIRPATGLGSSCHMVDGALLPVHQGVGGTCLQPPAPAGSTCTATQAALPLQSRALVATLLQRVILVTADDSLPILKSRQRTAFPPNYIHSLDSSHMLMTAVACKRAGGHSCLPVCFGGGGHGVPAEVAR